MRFGELLLRCGSNMIDKTLKIGFIGAGKWIQTYHLPTALMLSHDSQIALSGIWNRTKATASTLKDEFMIDRVFDSAEELMCSSHIDGVVIAVSREFTASMLRLAHKYKKPVLVEKPPARDYTEASLLANDITSPVLVAFNRAFTPLFGRLKEMNLDQITSGKVVFHRKERFDSEFVLESGIHALMNNHLLFGEGTLVDCQRIPTKNPEVPRWVAKVSYPTFNKTLIEYDFHPYSNQAIERYSYFSDTQKIQAFFNQHFAPDDEERIEATHIQDGDTNIVGFESYNPLQRQGYVGEYEAFVSMIRHGKSSPITLHDTVTIMCLATQIQECL